MSRLPAVLLLSLALSACRGEDSDLPPAYRRLEVPEEHLRSSEVRARGRQLFVRNCALCHGERADGRGARSEGLARRPADFTHPAWRGRASPRRVFYALREGVRGTPMPSFRGAFDEDETWDLVAYVLSVAAGGHAEARELPKTNEPTE